MEYIEVVIDETGRDSLKEKGYLFNTIVEKFKDLKEAREFIIERYGKMPRIRRENKIYIDVEDGTSQEVGFSYSFWNRDCSHNSKYWYQTDFICVYKVNREPVGKIQQIKE